MNRYRTILAASIATAVVLSGCAPRMVVPEAGPPMPPPILLPIVPDPAVPISFPLEASPTRYTVTSTSVIYSAADTTVPLDSVRLEATMSLSVQRVAGQIEVRGNVLSMQVTSGLDTARTTALLEAPVAVVRSTGLTRIVEPTVVGDTICGTLRETAVDLVANIFPVIPQTITMGQQWTDRIEINSCRGGIALRSTATLELSVPDHAGANTSRVLGVQSAAALSLSGSGKQGASTVTLQGRGTRLASWTLDMNRGVLLSGVARSQLTLNFDLGYRTDEFIQHSVATIERAR